MEEEEKRGREGKHSIGRGKMGKKRGKEWKDNEG